MFDVWHMCFVDGVFELCYSIPASMSKSQVFILPFSIVERQEAQVLPNMNLVMLSTANPRTRLSSLGY